MAKKKTALFREEKKLLRELFQEVNNTLALDFTDSTLAEELHLTPQMISRRTSVAIKYLEKAKRLFAMKYHSLPYIDDYLSIATVASQGTKLIDDTYFPLLGAVIWMLDYYKDNDLHSELIKVLPAGITEPERYKMPQVKDSTHPECLISAVTTIIMERESTCAYSGTSGQVFRK